MSAEWVLRGRSCEPCWFGHVTWHLEVFDVGQVEVSASFLFIFFFFFLMWPVWFFSLSHGSNPCVWLVNLRGKKRIISAHELMNLWKPPFCISVGVIFPSGLSKQPNMDLQHTTGGYWQAVHTCGRGYGDWRFRLILSLQKLPSHISSEQPAS